jgi:hypothetical protein
MDELDKHWHSATIVVTDNDGEEHDIEVMMHHLGGIAYGNGEIIELHEQDPYHKLTTCANKIFHVPTKTHMFTVVSSIPAGMAIAHLIANLSDWHLDGPNERNAVNKNALVKLAIDSLCSRDYLLCMAGSPHEKFILESAHALAADAMPTAGTA